MKKNEALDRANPDESIDPNIVKINRCVVEQSVERAITGHNLREWEAPSIQ
jgi:hypothetical protein